MLNFDYDFWKEVCINIEKYADIYGKCYLQLYPFTFSYSLHSISEKKFYDSIIKNGAIFELNNFNFPDNFDIKKDGSLRKRNLLTPIIYLYYIAIGKYISNKFKPIAIAHYDCYYAGNFKYNEYHYKRIYKDYITVIKENALKYDYYLKLDIHSFFDSIDLKKLKLILVKNGAITETESYIIEKFLSLCGSGKMPQIECGITSSYLATICYLNELDNQLVKYLLSYKNFKSFKVTRYVDDLFIFFTSNRKVNQNEIENDIVNYLNTIYYDYSLSINRDKTKLKRTSKIYSDINAISIDENLEIEKDNDELFRRNIIHKFLKHLIKCINENGINYKKYNEIVNTIFYKKKVRYRSSQIYNNLIYHNSKWISNTETIDALKKALDSHYNVLSLDPRKLTTLILKTEDSKLIKKMLEKLFDIYRKGEWDIFCTHIALIYLFNSGFKHIDLLSIIKEKDYILYNYILSYCKVDWHLKCISKYNYKFATRAYKTNSNLYYLSLMYIYELKNENYLTAFAYYKSFFDVKTAHFEHIKDSKNKFSVENYYKKNNLIKFYKKYSDSVEKILKDTFKYRNGNPVCHGSCQVLDKHNQTKLLCKNIDDLEKIIESYIDSEL